MEQPGRVLIAYDAEHREEALQLAKAMRSSDDEVIIITQLVSEYKSWSNELLNKGDGQFELRGMYTVMLLR